VIDAFSVPKCEKCGNLTVYLKLQLTSLKWAEQKADVVQERIKDLQGRRMRLVQLQSHV